MPKKKTTLELSERQIEIQILEYLNLKGIFAWKVKTMGTFDPVAKKFRTPSKYYITGQPDISAIYQGKFIGIEVKSKTGKASRNQLAFLQRIRENGGIAIIARSVEDVIGLVSTLGVAV